jgi:hypothetical protein
MLYALYQADTTNVARSAVIHSEYFSQRISQKRTEVIERYNSRLEPRGFMDTICYHLDLERVLKHNIVKEVLSSHE